MHGTIEPVAREPAMPRCPVCGLPIEDERVWRYCGICERAFPTTEATSELRPLWPATCGS